MHRDECSDVKCNAALTPCGRSVYWPVAEVDGQGNQP
jgi:hypothetical protein